MKTKALLFLVFASFVVIFNSCKKVEPKIITETKTITIHDTATTFILVRHAETTGAGTNPNLSTAGQSRATDLDNILDPISLSAVFSTGYNRTMQTATPIAQSNSLTVKNYDPNALEAFAESSIKNYHGEKILIVGHSNTTPELLNILTGTTNYSTLPDTEYDNLFVVTVFEKGRADVTPMKYGN